MRRLFGALLAALVLAGPVLAVTPGERLADPAQEARARAISRELRCVVCQNQSIDDSDAELARDLRGLVRERLAAGDSDSEVFAYLTERYGQFVLLRPAFDAGNAVLWVAPFATLAAALLGALVYARRRRAAPTEAPLREDEERALADLLARRDG